MLPWTLFGLFLPDLKSLERLQLILRKFCDPNCFSGLFGSRIIPFPSGVRLESKFKFTYNILFARSFELEFECWSYLSGYFILVGSSVVVTWVWCVLGQ